MAPGVPSNTEQFRQSFREEAREILTDLEEALLALIESPGDKEIISRIFRGLHTIKGSGAMFGFDCLAAFVHDIETAYDLVRNGRLHASPALIDLTLAALDQIAAMLNDGPSGVTLVDPGACDRIVQAVRAFAGSEDNTAPVAPNGAMQQPHDSQRGTGELREWRIQFVPGTDLMRYGANPLLLIRELRQLGSLSVRSLMDSIPPLTELDPERCYIRWEMTLATSEPVDAIRDVFIFVEDTCELTVEPSSDCVRKITHTELADMTRKSETKLGALPGPCSHGVLDPASSLRIPATKLDQFVDLVGELVTVQARLTELATRSNDAEVSAVSEEVERLTSALRESSMNLRMMPVRGTFEKFRRLVHDLARDLGKRVVLTMQGEDTELDKTVIEQLGDPLMHLIRNSMDHGIEPPDIRAASGKPEAATIQLSARHSGASVLVSVSDDGRGIDSDAVRHRAIERGLLSPEAELTESQVFGFIFQPGFSTAKRVTDVSGRGVGMDVVRRQVENLRGLVEVMSKRGQGTTVTLRLPLTMAIIDGLLVAVGNACFVLPLASTLECIELTRNDVQRANGKHLAIVRGEIVPYVRLRELFQVTSKPPEIEQVMLVDTGEGRFGFVVDQVLGNCQTVIKSLGRFYRHVQAVSGATILGNGTVALILDPVRLIQDAVREENQGALVRAAGAGGNRPGRSAVPETFTSSGSAGPSASARVETTTEDTSCSSSRGTVSS